jgi:glucose-6-phosphate 1-epimerase
VDRIYVNTPDTLRLVVSPTRAFRITKTGLPDAVVWNPWAAKAQSMSDFGDDEYKCMVCVEPALAAGSGAPAMLEAGGEWICTQELVLE